jgi:hypothetical protein
VSEDDTFDPTKPTFRFVGSEEEQSRALRRILAGLLKFLRREPSGREVVGDLSSWVGQLHGIQRPAKDYEAEFPNLSTLKISELLAKFGPKLDPAEMQGIIERGESLRGQPSFAAMMDAAERANLAELDDRLREVTENAVGPWLTHLPDFDFSLNGFYRNRRAVRVTMIALALHDIHPLILISKASRGDKEAVLKLVKIDPFSCWTAVLRE